MKEYKKEEERAVLYIVQGGSGHRNDVMLCRYDVMLCRHEVMLCRNDVMLCSNDVMLC